MKIPPKDFLQPKYYLDSKDRFIIENYHRAYPFSNFFSGIAGLWGIPMWIFYANRGQCISSFGIESKDKAIMEFQPANKAYRLTSLQGFRTFVKIKERQKEIFYEPFQDHSEGSPFVIKRRMAISSHDLTIEEINHTLGLSFTVNYFSVPSQPYAAFVRDITIRNIGRKRRNLEIIDGMPLIIPFGLTDHLQKYLSRTIEAWNRVVNLEHKAPYYNLRVVVSDRPEVKPVEGGNFYFNVLYEKKGARLLDVIADPACIFGSSLDFCVPQAFYRAKNFTVPRKQNTVSRSLCAMSFVRLKLSAKQEKRMTSLIGHADSLKMLEAITAQAKQREFIDVKAQENKNIVEGIKNNCFTVSDSRSFNLCCGQTFLDNVLRGGLPITFETTEGKVVFNVYSRKHGDPERDYNYFVLKPTYLSQGNGNYRDINQNRRNDVWFNPDIKESHIVNLVNLIQADGYNPLVVKGLVFSADDPKDVEGLLKKYVPADKRDFVAKLLTKGFQAGELLKSISQNQINLKISPVEFLKNVLSHCHKHEMAEHGEGFWTDHWTYNLDLIERFLAIYPEAKRSLLLDKKIFTFYYNAFCVLPREQRYILTENGPRQYHSVVLKKENVKSEIFDHKLRTNQGEGPVYFTNLLAKLLCVVANKAASLDPSGIGIEMEADKPNWYDALNGLPGLLGSSLNETFELKRLCLFLRKTLKDFSLEEHWELQFFEELLGFVSALHDVLASGPDSLSYWRRSNEIKEHYRRRIEHGISGEERNITVGALDRFLQLVIEKTNKAIKSAKNSNGLYAAYFTHEITTYESLSRPGESSAPVHLRPLQFNRKVLPLFLEGFVHALRVENEPQKARLLYQKVRRSPLFDKKLKMYRVNDDLSKESLEIGRARVFPAGWLENQSIWLHMQYKFLLELLRGGLHKEFYENFKNTLVPFMNPKIYGRSILENSSFIVSSAHEDQSLHGRGFVARLSGSTAEWLHMWLTMNMGENPFWVDAKGKLNLAFRPILAKWLFTKKGTACTYYDKKGGCQKISIAKNCYAFNFLGATLVVYHNPRRRDTFGKNCACVKEIVITPSSKSKPIVIASDTIPAEYANDIRDNKVERIDIYLK